MRGDGIRLGWRSLVGVVLIVTLLLHGFDAAFVADGYTLSILGLLVVLALAGELESARVAGIDVRFRRLTLSRIEQELDELPPSSTPEEEEVSESDENANHEDLAEGDMGQMRDHLHVVARTEPGAAVVAFFGDIEQAVKDLYRPLKGETGQRVSFREQVDFLARYGVIPASEARVVLDLAGLRNAYMHGRGVDPDEAARLVAIGARLLPSLSRARMKLGSVFEDQVAEIIESVPNLSFMRQPVLDGDGRPLRPDFVITSPVRLAIEAMLAADSASLRKRLLAVEGAYRGREPKELIMVVPRLARGKVNRSGDSTWLTVVSIDRLRALLEDRMKDGAATTDSD